MDSRLLLDGGIPGLLARGAPVIDPRGRNRVIYGVADGLAWSTPTGAVIDARSFRLNLSHPAGVDRTVRWVAERFGIDASTGAVFCRNPINGYWELIGCKFSRRHFAAHPCEWPHHPDMWLQVPSLASIPLDNPNADVLALAAVVRHLAGVAS